MLIAVSLVVTFASIRSVNATKYDEFYNPLGDTTSSSFEGPAGSSIYTPPPGWSATGGQRFLLTDFNGDGKCDLSDVYRVSLAFGKDRDMVCDVNKDRKVDLKDVTAVALNYGKSKTALQGDYSWFIGGSGDWYMTRYIESFCIPFLRGDVVMFGFWFKPDRLFAPNGSVRAEVIIHYEGSQETFEGVWIAPIGKNWSSVYVRATPGLMQSAEVRIHLQNIKGFVDCAIVTVRGGNSTNIADPIGAVMINSNIFSYRKEQPGVGLNGDVRMVSALCVEAQPGYFVHWVQLKVTRTSSGDAFNVNIVDCDQGNDKNYQVDPAVEEKRQQDMMMVASFVIPVVVSGVLTFGVGSVLGAVGFTIMESIVTRYIASTTFNAGLKIALPYFASDPDHRLANGGSEGDSAWETWPYPGEGPYIGHSPGQLFVNISKAMIDFKWLFNTETGDIFRIRIEATACFAQAKCKIREIMPPIWYLEDKATYSTYIDLSIAA
jgi:hypothetical protein